ncbi:MAG: glycoside hydrolase family 2 protein [Lachnospiraceae bacterium]|nr:glycoside hydrolase family 2 protein [Lachnospiraceae bacterium]
MEKIAFNNDWRFRKQESTDSVPVTLPHDAQILEQRSADASNGGHGYFPGGVYVYEKTFCAPAEWEGKTVLVEFEGIYRNSEISLNGVKIGGRPYGYTTFALELTGLRSGEENTLTVVADNSQIPNSRWYTGAGIYRPVWLYVGEKEHINYQGVKISTLSHAPAKIRVETSVTGGDIGVEILDGNSVVASGEGSPLELEIPGAKLWSDETPNLYTCRVILTKGGEIVDSTEETFGVRTVHCDPKGFYVNDKRTLLRGGCFHHDNGILGAATYDESEWRRVRIMKEMGFNALRSSHNPTSRALLEACDYYGMYLMDETFDMWYLRKSKYDYGMDFEQWWQEDTSAMVNRDFNHPSVILYSIGNEVSEPGKKKGVEMAGQMVNFIHELDSNRLVTGGMNLMLMSNYSKGKGQYDNVDKEEKKKDNDKEPKNASLMFNVAASVVGTGMNKAANSDKVDAVVSPVLDILDIAGYNYASGRYPKEGAKHPDRVIFGSETFPQDIYKNWEMVKKYSYLIGDFMWTAWDYLGEAGIGAWSYTGGMPFNRPYPWVLAGAGVIDILGNPDASCKYASTVWGLEKKPVIGVRPVNHPGVRVSKSVWRGTNAMESWAFNGCDGNKAQIEVYAQAASVELLLNGKSLGKKKLRECKAMFKTKYVSGTLTAVAYDEGGREISRNELRSASGKISVVIKPEVKSAKPGGIIYVPVALEGENGVVESGADRKLTVSVKGGELLAFGSANPCTKEQYHTGSFTTYYGRALAVVRVRESVTITVTDGIQKAEAFVAMEK